LRERELLKGQWDASPVDETQPNRRSSDEIGGGWTHEVCAVTASNHEAWQRWYEAWSHRRRISGSGIKRMLRRLDARRLRQRILVIGSGVFLVAMTLAFYAVLDR
jgi:hypothetical protein